MTRTWAIVGLVLLSARCMAQEQNPATYIQFDETLHRELFRCSRSYNDGCVLAEGVSLSEVVAYFYRQQERSDQQYNALWQEHMRTLKQEEEFLDKLTVKLDGILKREKRP